MQQGRFMRHLQQGYAACSMASTPYKRASDAAAAGRLATSKARPAASAVRRHSSNTASAAESKTASALASTTAVLPAGTGSALGGLIYYGLCSMRAQPSAVKSAV